ncbi:AAA family ATPase [Agrococcus sp. SCSIO52902]|uniref:AAA family ATPase n=1 Tax=Agrococcus sp. SCSIO52902 TaxID=2933290 RepID=UPI001FF59F13|nr:AAA family ATPase [Agrococcus sp. SCSIO52902]UOW00020.1 AAA family ATPase [Agrococcus sp. SCSIO52902]
MSNVLLRSDSEELRARVLEASAGTCIAVPVGAGSADPAELLAQVRHESLPDVIVIDASRSPGAALELAGRLDIELPGTAVLLIGDVESLAVSAMHAGVRDVLAPEADISALRASLERASQAALARRALSGVAMALPMGAAAPARVITVLSPKGGAGKTTLATNVAVGLAEFAPGGVVLVDLDVQFGDVATALGVEPEFTLDAIVQGAGLRDPIALKTQLTQHSSGLLVICAPEDPVAADALDSDQVASLLSMLASQFPFVVVDTAAGLEPRTLAALDHTTDPILLTTFDVPGSRGMRREIATLRELGMLNTARQVVLNFADPKAGLTVADVESTIRASVDLTMPFSKSATAAMNIGEPLIHHSPKDPVSKQIRRLLGAYAPQRDATRGRSRR